MTCIVQDFNLNRIYLNLFTISFYLERCKFHGVTIPHMNIHHKGEKMYRTISLLRDGAYRFLNKINEEIKRKIIVK